MLCSRAGCHGHNVAVVHLVMPSVLVADENREEAKAGDVEQEEHKWFDGEEADAIVGPRTVVIHHVHAAVAAATMVHGLDFL